MVVATQRKVGLGRLGWWPYSLSIRDNSYTSGIFVVWESLCGIRGRVHRDVHTLGLGGGKDRA